MKIKVQGAPTKREQVEGYDVILSVADTPIDFPRENYFWCPIAEFEEWGYTPFLVFLEILKKYHNSEKILIHCHAGFNRSATVAYVCLRVLHYSDEAISEILETYSDPQFFFKRNVENWHVDKDIIEKLKKYV